MYTDSQARILFLFGCTLGFGIGAFVGLYAGLKSANPPGPSSQQPITAVRTVSAC
jgi:hypothetical protein